MVPRRPDDRNGDPRPPALPLGDGSVLRGRAGGQIYVIYGGARFLVASAADLPGLGLDPARMRTVADELLEEVETIPRDGTVLKERVNPKVYVTYSARKFWIPNPGALFTMGLDWGRVRTVPDGALAGLPEVTCETGSVTPGSLAFPPDNDGRHFARTGVPGTTRVVSRGRETRLVELRGWLYPVDPGYVVNDERPNWVDWHYLLELDPTWTDQLGIDLNQVLTVGNIIDGLLPASSDPYRAVSLPAIQVEINGIPTDVAEQPWWWPRDWNTSVPEDPSVRWQFDPRLGLGQIADPASAPYARVAGSLITDQYHAGGQFAAWAAGTPNTDPSCPARSVEIHPPHLIELLPAPAPGLRTETIRGIAAVAGNGLFDGGEQTVDAVFSPPTPRPPRSRPRVRELVGPETNPNTIVEGNDQRDGARITILEWDARVHVKVARTGVFGTPGKFKAVYRLDWERDPTLPGDITVTVEPSPLPTGTPVTVAIRATDAETGGAVAGDVLIDGVRVAPTNTAFTAAFDVRRTRVFDPVTRRWIVETIEPTGEVTAPGYTRADIAFAWA